MYVCDRLPSVCHEWDLVVGWVVVPTVRSGCDYHHHVYWGMCGVVVSWEVVLVLCCVSYVVFLFADCGVVCSPMWYICVSRHVSSNHT